MHSKSFSMARVIRALLVNISFNKKRVSLFFLISIFAIPLLHATFVFLLHLYSGIIEGFYFGMLFLGGMILTTTVSERDSDFKKGFLSNISPMTVSEKFIVRYLWTGPLFFIAFQAMFMIISVIDKSIIMSLGTPYFPLKEYSPEEFWQIGKISMIGPYLICHIVFFTLGQLFRKNSFVYSIFILSIVIFLTVSLDMINRYIAVRGTDITWGAGDSVFETLKWVLSGPTKQIWLNQIFAYFVVFPSLFVAAYKLTKEREV